MIVVLSGVCCLSSGCRWIPPLPPLPRAAPQPIEVPVSNPAHISPTDPDFLWRQIVDSIDDYFKIESETPIRLSPDSYPVGRLTTYPEISGTSLEPWRGDTSRGFERLQSTFQTIRRTATVDVTREEHGYSIEIRVIKEKEDVDQSQFSAAGSAAQRHDGTIVRNDNQLRQLPVTLGWYEIGRDRELERRLMADILGRVSNLTPPKNR